MASVVLGNTTSHMMQNTLNESKQGHIPRAVSEMSDTEEVVAVVPVLRSPALHEAHANGAHASELVHRLEALIHRLSQKSCKLLVIKNLQITAWTQRDLKLT